MKASFFPYQLRFKHASGTSRGVIKIKDTWFIKIDDEIAVGIGECGMFRGLSCDDRPDFEAKLQWACKNIDLGLNHLLTALAEFPAIQFGLEMAFLDLKQKHLTFYSLQNLPQEQILFPSTA